MPYTPGTYICFDTAGFVPRVIKLATHSRLSHAALITSTDGEMVEAMPGGARKAHASEYAGCYALVSTPEGDAAHRALVVEAAEMMVGVSYNDLGIVDDGLESLGVFWKWLADIANSDHEVICSQLVALCGARGGFDWLCGKKLASEVTPGDLGRRPGMQPVEVKA